MAAVSVIEFEKSLNALKEAFLRLDTRTDEVDYKINRDACIQRFEFCVELAWKTSMRNLGLQSMAPRPAVREMAQAGLIFETKTWFSFLDERNKSSHTYDEEVAKEVLLAAKNFIPEGEALLARLKKQ